MTATQQHLTQLETSGLIRLVEIDPELEYLFRHTLIQEAAYTSLLKEDRKRLHLVVGEALELTYPDREEVYGLLAYHFSRAEAWEKTLRHARLAADRAKRLYATAEALDYFGLALKALARLAEGAAGDGEQQAFRMQRFDILSQRHGAWTLIGQFERARADLDEMIVLARQMGDDARLSDALNGLGYLYLNTGTNDARVFLEEALAVKRRLGDQRGQADSLNTLSTLYVSVGEIPLGLASSEEAHRIYEALGDVDGLARSEWAIGAARYEAVGEYDRAIRHMEKSLALSRQTGNRALECGSLLMIGAANIRLGDYASGQAFLEQTMALARRIGDRHAEGWALLYLSWADREARQLEASLARAQQALAMGRELGADFLSWYALYSLARVYLALARLNDAHACADEAHRHSQKISIWWGHDIKAQTTLARAQLGLGNLDEAGRFAREALAGLETLYHGQGVAEVHGVYLDCYHVLRACGAPEAGAVLQQAQAAMLAQAEAIADPERRARFLGEVAMNREIRAALAREAISEDVNQLATHLTPPVKQMHLALIGGEEFADGFEAVHAGLLADLGSERRRVVFLPTCAADDGDEAIDYWCTVAREKLSVLGASVEALRVVDSASANEARHARLVAEADWIYFGGGYPHVAMRILENSRLLEALWEALKRGALVTGSSGGAMLMCARSWVVTPEHAAEVSRVWAEGPPPDWDPPISPMLDCLGLLPRCLCSPHFDRLFPYKWIERGLVPKGYTLIGIDEQTALVGTGEAWEVRGRGGVTLFRDDRMLRRYEAGERFGL